MTEVHWDDGLAELESMREEYSHHECAPAPFVTTAGMERVLKGLRDGKQQPEPTYTAGEKLYAGEHICREYVLLSEHGRPERFAVAHVDAGFCTSFHTVIGLHDGRVPQSELDRIAWQLGSHLHFRKAPA